MGFRSTFTTTDTRIEWPKWFVEKYKKTILFREGNKGSLQSDGEWKVFGTWDDLLQDIKKVLKETRFYRSFVLVFLHEDNVITKCEITEDIIFTVSINPANDNITIVDDGQCLVGIWDGTQPVIIEG